MDASQRLPDLTITFVSGSIMGATTGTPVDAGIPGVEVLRETSDDVLGRNMLPPNTPDKITYWANYAGGGLLITSHSEELRDDDLLTIVRETLTQ